MNSLIKKTLNLLKCPVCKSQIDLLGWKDKSDGRKYNFCCASNWEHYRLLFVHWEVMPYIDYETVVVYNDHHMYHVTQYFDNGNNKTEIFIYEVDAENRIIDSKDKKTLKLSYDKKLFDFSQTNKEKIINRIKTILVFS